MLPFIFKRYKNMSDIKYFEKTTVKDFYNSICYINLKYCSKWNCNECKVKEKYNANNIQKQSIKN